MTDPSAGPAGLQRDGLRLKHIAIDTQRENVAYLHRGCSVYRAEEFQTLSKVEIAANGSRLLATLNIVDDPAILAPDELGLSTPAFRRFDQAQGVSLTICQASPPKGLEAIRAKIRGETLSGEDLHAIMADVAAHRFSKMELAAFLVASAAFMTSQEVLELTRAMAAVGNRLSWPGESLVVDKHCIGGIPGNRTSMIVVPIVAAHGLPFPKTSSRAITSPAGTADTMEVLARVDLDGDRMQEVVRQTRGCLVWGGYVNLSPADDVLISVERPLGVDTREQMVASILSKKLAAGSTHLVIDIPVGPTAKVRSRHEAVRLRKLFEWIGDSLALSLEVVITDGSRPIGRGVGPVLEARDVMQVLRNDSAAPSDLRERALLLAGRVIDLDPDIRGGQGVRRARELIDSGAALATMEQIIQAQGPQERHFPLGTLVHEVVADRDGQIAAIDCYQIARIARLAGAPTDKGSGIDLLKTVGAPVSKGEPVYRLHASLPADYHFAVDLAGQWSGVTVA